MVFDAHTHIKPDECDRLLGNKDIIFMASSSSAEEYEFYESKKKQFGNLHFSCGIHPWRAEKIDFQALLPYLEKASYIGEIGLDGIWCDTDMEIQEEVFIKQLDYAQNAGKPVILHTKACEKRIAEIIKPYTMPVLVHWYSAGGGLEEYMAKNCYFTIGPSVGVDENVSNVARLAPIDRIMVETDGLSAVEWALGKKYAPQEANNILENSINIIADLRGVEASKLKEVIFKNSLEFFGLNV